MLSTSEVRSLLCKLCVDLGFCLPTDAEAQIEEDPPSTAVDFTNAVFTAEGLDPSKADRHLYRQVRAMVTEAFHASQAKRDMSRFTSVSEDDA